MPYGNEGECVQVSIHTHTDNEPVRIRALACTQKQGGVSGVRRVNEGGDGNGDGISTVVSSWGG
jgi:hypothetical protein